LVCHWHCIASLELVRDWGTMCSVKRKTNSSLHCSDGCGWWSSNDGSGWYSAGDVFSFDSKPSKSGEPDTIESGDVVGVLIDRDQGKQYFFKNGVLQKPVVTDKRFRTLEDLYPTFIILHKGRINLLPTRHAPHFTEP
jgi:hypothetical protein